MALAVDAIGAPINVGNAVDVSAAAFVNAARMGDGWGAAAAVLDAPAVVANGFLNGQSVLPLAFNIGSFPTTTIFP